MFLVSVLPKSSLAEVIFSTHHPEKRLNRKITIQGSHLSNQEETDAQKHQYS